MLRRCGYLQVGQGRAQLRAGGNRGNEGTVAPGKCFFSRSRAIGCGLGAESHVRGGQTLAEEAGIKEIAVWRLEAPPSPHGLGQALVEASASPHPGDQERSSQGITNMSVPSWQSTMPTASRGDGMGSRLTD